MQFHRSEQSPQCRVSALSQFNAAAGVVGNDDQQINVAMRMRFAAGVGAKEINFQRVQDRNRA